MNLIKKIIIAGSVVAAMGSCTKNNLAPDDYMVYKIDGVSETAKPEASSYSDNTVMITGTKGSDDITLFIDTDISVGTYHFGGMKDKVAAMYVNWDNSIFFHSESGTLVINSYDGKQISGVFRFKASSDQTTKNFTEGQFTAPVTFDSYSYTSPDTTGCGDEDRGLIRRQTLMRQVKSQQRAGMR